MVMKNILIKSNENNNYKCLIRCLEYFEDTPYSEFVYKYIYPEILSYYNKIPEGLKSEKIKKKINDFTENTDLLEKKINQIPKSKELRLKDIVNYYTMYESAQKSGSEKLKKSFKESISKKVRIVTNELEKIVTIYNCVITLESLNKQYLSKSSYIARETLDSYADFLEIVSKIGPCVFS